MDRNKKEEATALRTHTLPCGLRVVHRPDSGRVAYCGVAVDAGTRDELDNESGMAHFLEHLLFKGTRHRKAWHILNRMESVGGDLNAYTNKEETVVYSAFLTEHFARAAELLTDIVFFPTFPPRELEKEAEVVIDEILSYEDNPAELIFDDFEALLFGSHPLGRNILGSPERLQHYRTEEATAFWQRCYRPQGMVFFVQGNLDFRRVVSLLERLTEDIPASPSPELRRTPPGLYVPRTLVSPRDIHQAHVMTGTRVDGLEDDHRRIALCLLANLLGGPGMNSRLNLSLRERRGLVYNVEANLTTYTDTGLLAVYFGCDATDADRCTDLTLRELQRLYRDGLTAAQLAAAQKQLVGQMGVAADNRENMALSMAKSYLHYGKVETQEEVARLIFSLTPDRIREVARETLAEERMSRLAYVPR